MLVKFKITAAMTPMMIMVTIGTGMPSTVLPKKLTKPEVEMGRPSEMTKVRPRAMDMVARVAMKEGSLRKALAMPDRAPKKAPARTPTITVSQAGMPREAPV